MAHIAKLGALTDELVTLLTSTSPKSDPARFNVYRESALRRLRYHNYPRTNQFDVASRLDGLEEKFRVYCEDPLADALKERVDKLLKKSSKWIPEVLHLLLELSDKPVSKAKLEDLEFLREPEPEAGPPLKWRDIVAEDPLMREKSVWKNVDFGAESSDDGDEFEESRSETSDVTRSTVLSSVDEESSRRPENYVEEIGNEEDLDSLRKAQFWHRTTDLESRPGTHITELQAIREVLFMLFGLPTSLFEVSTNTTTPTVTPSKNYSLKHASIEAFRKLSQTFATQGSAVLLLRSWIKRTQGIPLLQALQNSISERIIVLDTFLSKIEQRYIAITEDIVVSIIGLQTEISSCIRPLLRLAEIITRLDEEPYAHAFRYLEILYDETCILQMAGDDELYRFMGELFFECFQIYLRPIRTWMEEGELGQGDKVFFISEASGDVQPALLWQSRYKLRRTQTGVLHAPKFLKTAANKIFTTGKSVVVLKHLNQFNSLKTSRSRYEPTLDFNTVCNPWSLSLAPFSELFEQAFDSWIQSKHHLASLTLRKTLFDSCGLYSSLEALTHVYFLSDGAASSFFASSIFDKLDTLDVSWNDRFTLNSLIQSTIGNNVSISSSHLRTVIIPLPRKYQDINRCRRTVKTLSCINLKYFLPWPILLVLNQSSFPSYQRIFTFLLQIRRCSHILTRSRLISDRLLNAGSASERALYYAIRTRLLWFTQTLYHYLAIFVLSPNSQTMFCNLRDADDVDSMITVHSTYVKKMIDQTLLGSKLEPIHKTILTILDIGIKLEDAHAINVAAQTAAEEEQQDLMDLSYASLGLTPTKRARASKSKLAASTSRQREREEDSSSDDSEKEIDVDLSIMSVGNEVEVEIPYDEKLRNLKNEFDRGVKFVAGGLRGVARAGAAPDNAKAWDLLGEMLEEGIGSGNGIGIGGRSGF